MNGRRIEHHAYTREQATEHLRAALAIVAELDPPSDLREAAFTNAVSMLSRKDVQIEQVLPAGLLAAAPRL